MYIWTIDIAHPPLSYGAAEETLDYELRQARNTKERRVLKVIHGYGSTTGQSVLKELVGNWSYRNRGHLLAVIPGEKYGILDAKTMEMRKTCGHISDPDLDANNPGITVIWVK
jgi:hypothetical protein